MPALVYQFPIRTSPSRVFAAISTPEGLDAWWTERASGKAEVGAEFDLLFAPDYHWRAIVTRCLRDREFEIQMTEADADWRGSVLRFRLDGNAEKTTLEFTHTGWPEQNEHYRISSYCWAMYLRLLRRYLENGEVVPYAQRLDV